MTDDMSAIVKARLEEICPNQNLSEIDVIEAEKSCMIAFKIIGYVPEDFDKSFKKAWESSDAELLSEFVFDVWRCNE